MKKSKNENDCLREQSSYLLELSSYEMVIWVLEAPFMKVNYTSNLLTEIFFYVVVLKMLLNLLKIPFGLEKIGSWG